MNELKIFENEQFGQIRAIEKGGEPWFVAADVCRALELEDVNKAISRLDDDEGARIEIPHPQNPEKRMTVNAVNEPGLYSLVLGSRKPKAKAFKRWITHEVLPSIRKTGGYQARPMTSYQQQNIGIQKAKLLNLIASEYDGTYKQVLQAYATKELTGEFLLPLPELERRTYSAGEIGAILGISKKKVGAIANENNLKTDAYGKWFVDKSPYSKKEVQSFRYYENIIPVLRELI